MATFNYTQTFDGLSNADLSGQDSWTRASGSANDQQVQATTFFKGGKAVQVQNANTYYRNFTAHTSGVAGSFHVMRIDTAPSSGDGLFAMHREQSTGRYGAAVKFVGATPTLLQYLDTTGWVTLLSGVSLTSWYVINMETDLDANKVRYRYKVSGGSWSSWTSWLDPFGTAAGQIDRILTGQDSGVAYYDEISDTEPTPSTAYTQTLDESLALADAIRKTAAKSLNDTVTLVDSLVRDTQKNINENIVLVDSIQASRIFYRELSDTLTLIDNAATKTVGKTLFEAITLVDTIQRDLQRTINEVVTLDPSINSSRIYYRQILEEITLIDTITKQTGKNLSEILALADSLSRAVTYNKSLDEVVTLVATIEKTTGHVVSDAITLADTLAKVGTFARDVDETVTLQERFQGLINGQDISWFRKYTDQATTWIKKYLEIP